MGASGIPSETNLKTNESDMESLLLKKKKPILLEGKSLLAAVYHLHLQIYGLQSQFYINSTSQGMTTNSLRGKDSSSQLKKQQQQNLNLYVVAAQMNKVPC